jgi:predicted transcriptional regulator
MRKAGPPRELPPPLELVCLKALWEINQGTIHDIREQLKTVRPFAYTTVMTLMERLVRRGAAARKKVGRGFVYSPVLDLLAARNKAVAELADAFFNGSTDDLRGFLNNEPVAEISTSGPSPSRSPSDDVTLL